MKKPKQTKPITELIRPTPEEDERINAGIAADPDTWELTLEDIKSMRPTSETHPEIVEAYKQFGPGWQSRIDEDLQDIIAKRQLK